jgi:hypothetical protein
LDCVVYDDLADDDGCVHPARMEDAVVIVCPWDGERHAEGLAQGHDLGRARWVCTRWDRGPDYIVRSTAVLVGEGYDCARSYCGARWREVQ